MRHTLVAVAAVAAGALLLSIACGGSTSSPLNSADGGGSSSGGSSSGGSSSGGSSDDGGCGNPPAQPCTAGCLGDITIVQPVCMNGSLVCPPEPEICMANPDAGPSDSGLSGDGAIDCLGTTCNAASDYCQIRGGGAIVPDAGSKLTSMCLPLPPMPCGAGTGCACIPDRCNCTDDGGYIKNECLFP